MQRKLEDPICNLVSFARTLKTYRELFNPGKKFDYKIILDSLVKLTGKNEKDCITALDLALKPKRSGDDY